MYMYMYKSSSAKKIVHVAFALVHVIVNITDRLLIIKGIPTNGHLHVQVIIYSQKLSQSLT